jgi:hypothetical protein
MNCFLNNNETNAALDFVRGGVPTGKKIRRRPMMFVMCGVASRLFTWAPTRSHGWTTYWGATALANFDERFVKLVPGGRQIISTRIKCRLHVCRRKRGRNGVPSSGSFFEVRQIRGWSVPMTDSLSPTCVSHASSVRQRWGSEVRPTVGGTGDGR